MSLDANGYADVAQSFAGLLTGVSPGGGTVTKGSTPEGTELAGVDMDDERHIAVTTTTFPPGQEGGATAATLSLLVGHRLVALADLYQYEQDHNPDSINTYGFQDLPAGCAAELPPFVPGDPYDGLLDAHPYAVLAADDGWIVADAAGNDLIKVTDAGEISTLAVLPPSDAVEVTGDLAAGLGLPDCAIGASYVSESVPTDVEWGPDGMLYVSTLSGDPAPGSVYRVDPATGEVTQVATGFISAVNLAIAPNGTIYVSQLFANSIAKVVGTGWVPVVELTNPAAIEWGEEGVLYATYDALGPDGKLVTITV